MIWMLQNALYLRLASRRSYFAQVQKIAKAFALSSALFILQGSWYSSAPTNKVRKSGKQSGRRTPKHPFSICPPTSSRNYPRLSSFRKSCRTRNLCDLRLPRRRANKMPTAEYLETVESNDAQSIVNQLVGEAA